MPLPSGALVTGGAQRLGRAIAIGLAQAGHKVAIHCWRSVAAGEATAAEIRAMGGSAAVVTADLADEAQTGALVGKAVAAIGPLGVLVNNASLFERDEWDTADFGKLDRAPDTQSARAVRADPGVCARSAGGC